MSVFRTIRDIVKATGDRTGTIDDRPSMRFPSLDLDKLKTALKLEERGLERGKRNEPPSETSSLDEVELDVVAAIGSLKDEGHDVFAKRMDVYDSRLNQIDLRAMVPTVKNALGSAEADFSAEVQKDTNYVFNGQEELTLAEESYRLFRKRHDLEHRLPADPSNAVFSFGIVAILFVLETVANASFFSATHPGGWLGAVFEAAGISVINLALGLILGLGCLRYVKLKGFGWRLSMGLAIPAFILAAIIWNFFAAHYRDAFQAIPPDAENFMAQASTMALSLLLERRWSLSGFQSYLMVAVGLLVVCIATFKGYTWTDSFPGYATVYGRYRRQTARYLSLIDQLVSDLQKRNADARDEIREVLIDINRSSQEYGTVIAQRTRFVDQYNAYLDGLQRTGDGLLQTYRSANRQARSTQAPSTFNKPWQPRWSRELVGKDTSGKERKAAADELIEAITASQERLLIVFREALAQYERLRDVRDRGGNGKAAE